MKNKSEVCVKLSEEQMCNNLIGFYDEVAKFMGYEDMASLSYDCTKINVAKNVQDAIIKAYQKQHSDAFANYPGGVMNQVLIVLAQSGPKVKEGLEDNTVEVLDGFICPNYSR